MKRSKAAKIIERTALKEGVSVAEVRRGIQEALDYAFENNAADSFWEQWRGRKPTLEQFIVAVSDEVLLRFSHDKAPLLQ